MAARINKARLPDKVLIDMTPLIDIVFQLLTFFVMTLKVASLEGDFNIKMPLANGNEAAPDIQPASTNDAPNEHRFKRQTYDAGAERSVL